MSAAVVVVSDTCAKDSSQDKVGSLLTSCIEHKLGFKSSIHFVGDEFEPLQKIITELVPSNRLIITTGGTGLSKRDITPEAVIPLLDKAAPGMVTAMLNYGLTQTPLAAIGRPVAGIIGDTLVISVPGSKGGALDSFNSVEGVIRHVLEVRDKPGRAAHAGGHVGSHGDGHKGDHYKHHKGGCKHSSSSHAHSHHGHSGPVFYGEAYRPRSSPYPMIPFQEAQDLVLSFAPSPKITKVRLQDSVGYILAEDIFSPLNVPPFRASIVDGYAVSHHDCPDTFPVKQVSYASSTIASFERHTCVRITTGAPVPHGATAVVPVEDTELAKEENGAELEVRINASNVQEGDNIREIGSDLPLNALVLTKGTRISLLGGEIGTLASIGLATVPVYSRPVVGVLSTGDEVVEAGLPCGQSHIWDANRPMLIASLKAHGFEVVDCGIVADTRESLRTALETALSKCDVLVSSGGVSMGELDLLKPTIEQLGGKLHFGRVAMKPGKPVTFATLNGKAIFALPGNPVSAAVCFHLFVLPFVNQSSGHTSPCGSIIKVKINFDAKLDPRPEFHRVHAHSEPSGWVASTTGFQRSSRIKSMVSANALLCLPAATEGNSKIAAGSLVDAILLDTF